MPGPEGATHPAGSPPGATRDAAGNSTEDAAGNETEDLTGSSAGRAAVTSDVSNQQYGYGPFHGAPRHTDALHPTSGGAARPAAPVPDANPDQAEYPKNPDGDPAYGSSPTSGAAGYGRTPIPGYGPTPASGGGPDYGSTEAAGGGSAYGEAYSTSGPPSRSATDPVSGSGPADPYGFSLSPSFGGGPRIEPTPKQPKGRFVLPVLAGLVAGLLLFGTGGWFLGRATADDPGAAQTGPPAPAPSAVPAAGPYEQNQIALNQPKFTGPLAGVAQGWLAHLSGCSRSGDQGGPALNRGEKVRVRCEMDAMSVIFVEYATAADRDKARVKTLGQNVDARQLTPGVGPAAERATPSGRTNGNYVEFAYLASGKTVSGLWWDDSAVPVAAYLLAFWKEGAGSRWEPMRDIWARYA